MTGARKFWCALLLIVLLVPSSVIVLIQFPGVQTSLCNHVANRIVGRLGGEASVGKIYFSFPNNLILKDILVSKDDGKDTVAYVGKLLLKVNAPSLLTENADIRKLSVEDAVIHSELFSELSSGSGKSATAKKDTASLQVTDRYRSIALDRLLLKNIALTTLNRNPNAKHPDRERSPYAMDWGLLDFERIDLEARQLFYSDSLTAVIENLSAKEAHGFDLKTFSCGILMTGQKLYADNLRYEDGYSNLDLNHFYLDFDSLKSFKHFSYDVTMDADFNRTLFDFHSLRFFTKMKELRIGLSLEGRVYGKVNRLASEGLVVHSRSGETSIRIASNIVGLPKGKETMASVKVTELQTNTWDIRRILDELHGGASGGGKGFGYGEKEEIRFSGSLDGLLTDFVAYGNVRTGSGGEVRLDAICRTNPGLGFSMDGFVDSRSLNLGLLMNNANFGEITGTTTARVMPGKNLSLSIDTLALESFDFKERRYENIGASGLVSKDGSNVHVTSNDSWVRFSADAVSSSLRLDDMIADIKVNSLSFDQDGEHFDVGDIILNVKSDGKGSLLSFHSDAADLEYEGDSDLSTVIKKLSDEDYIGINHLLDLKTNNLQSLLGVFVPELFVSEGTEFRYSLDSTGIGRGVFNSELLALGDNYLKEVSADVVIASEDTISVCLRVDTLQSGNIVAGNADFDFDIISDKATSFLCRIRDSRFNLAGNEWHFTSPLVGVAKRRVAINDFSLSSADHFITLDGVLGETPSDTLSVGVSNLDLSLFNGLFGKMRLSGVFNGGGDIISFYDDGKGLLIDLKGDSVAVNGNLMGDFLAGAHWNETDKAYDFEVLNNLSDRHPLEAFGRYEPVGKRVSATASFDSLFLGIAEPLLKNVVSDVTGSLSGRITAAGPVDSISVSGEECRLNDACFRVVYTNVPYTLTGPFNIDGKGIYLDGLSISDNAGNRGRVIGGLTYNKFKDVRIDTRIAIKEMTALDTQFSDNTSFYGKAFASGNVRISGGLDALQLSAVATTENGTVIHIPITSSAKEHKSLLTFVGGEKKRMSAYDSLRLRKAVKKDSGQKSAMEVRLMLDVNPMADLQIDINSSTGDILRARGEGKVNILAGGKENDFSIKGDYVVSSGDYNFNLMGLVSRDLTLEQGGNISFNGSIMETALDVTAKYRTKASISPLIADSSAVGNRRNVECGVQITGKLSNPQLSFSVEVPDLDPTVRSYVESALNSEDKKMKQMLALLLSGSFIPDQQGGIVNSTTVLYSNVSEIMANQFNNILHQLDIPLDLGFNYQPTTQGRDLFDVAISTQLFNNRVTINGNIGNRQFSPTGKNSSDIVGDVDVEIKLNSKGKLLLNLFSHSTDAFSNYLEQSQRNGAGIVFREEFDTFKELMQKIFWSKKRREEAERKAFEERSQRRNER